MPQCEQYATSPASAAQLCRLWSAHLDDLEHHLSVKRWAVTVLMVLMAYPLARIVFPALLHCIVPDVVRTVLNLI